MNADKPPEDTTTSLATSVDRNSHVATVEILRGPHNFFDLDLLETLAGTLERLAGEDEVRAVVLCSEGRNFCAGANLGDSSAASGVGPADVYKPGLRIFEQTLPLVAVVQGAAIGGGLGLALACDFRVASPSSRFAANFSLLGFHQGFGLSSTLPDVVGNQAALDLLLTGRRIGGEEAQLLGLADRLVDDERLRAEGADLAGSIADAGPLAVRAIRRTMRSSLVERVRTSVAHEAAEQERLAKTEDFAEGVAAVAERRQARFAGR